MRGPTLAESVGQRNYAYAQCRLSVTTRTVGPGGGRQMQVGWVKSGVIFVTFVTLLAVKRD